MPASGAFDLGRSKYKYLRQSLSVICAPEHAEQTRELMSVAPTPKSSLVGVGTGFAHGGAFDRSVAETFYTTPLALCYPFSEHWGKGFSEIRKGQFPKHSIKSVMWHEGTRTTVGRT